MRGNREIEALEPLAAQLEAHFEGTLASEAMQGVMHNGELTRESLATLGEVPFSEDIFLVAHRMNSPTPLHRHDYVEILCVLKGRVVNRMGEKDLYLLQDTVCAMERNSEHMLVVDDPEAVVCNVCLRDTVLEQPAFVRFLAEDHPVGQLARGELPNNYLVLSDMGNLAIKASLAQLIEAYAQAGYHHTFEVEARVMLFMVALSRAKTFSSEGADRRIVEIVDYIKENPAEASVGELARVFGYNENYLSQYFKRATGKNLRSVIIGAKLDRACDLLGESDLSVERVAHEVGYKSYSRFNQVFRERMGATPREWRAAHQG